MNWDFGKRFLHQTHRDWDSIMPSLRPTFDVLNLRFTNFTVRSPRPLQKRKNFRPLAQVRWSSATTEPRQPNAEGGTQGPPSPQSHIKYTSESYALLPEFVHSQSSSPAYA